MKINKYFSLLCLMTTLLCYSCSDDMGLKPNDIPVAGESKVVRIAASLDNGGSRLGYNSTDTSVGIVWDMQDTLKVINATTKEMALFSLTADSLAGKSSAVFEGTFENGCDEDAVLYVLYHNNWANAEFNEDGNIDISLKNQSGYLSADCQLMFGKTVYQSAKPVGVDLTHLVSVLEINIPTDKTLSKVYMEDENLSTKATLILGNTPGNYNGTFEAGDLVHCNDDDYTVLENGDRVRNDNHVIIAEGNFVPVNGVVTVYCYVLPPLRYDQDQSETRKTECKFSYKAVDTEGVEYVSSDYFPDGKTLDPGKVYSVTSGMFALEPFQGGDGTASNPYIIANKAQLYSFMWLASTEARNESGETYNTLAYKLVSDVELDGSIFWRDIHFNGGIFDGGNHTVSGVKENWFFDGISDGAKVSNLILDVDITIRKTGRSWFGSLSSVVAGTGTEVVNCHNIGDIDIDFYNQFAGALVGNFEWGARMIACSNTGNLTLDGSDAVGGLVGRVSTGATMEACFSTGTITVTSDWGTMFIGGVAGTVAYDEPEEYKGVTRMISCWENTTIIPTGKIETLEMGGVTAYGQDSIDCISCFTAPTVDEIAIMNAKLTEIASICRFDENGIPYIHTTSGGGANGEN